MIYNEDTHKLDYKFDYHIQEKQDIRNLMKEKEEIDIDDIRRIALWKYNRIINIDEKLLMDMSKLMNKKELVIDSKEVQEIIERLIECTGVGMPLASAVLKFIRPDVFPIIDVRAYRALFGKKIYKYTYTVYLQYCKRVYEIQNNLGIPLDEIDEQLYEFDKYHNGTI